MILLPNTIHECHEEIRKLHEEIKDWKLYSGEDDNSIRIVEARSRIDTITRFFREYAHMGDGAKGAANALVALSMCSYQRAATKRLVHNIFESLGIKSRDSEGYKLCDAYVCRARQAFKLLGYDKPIDTVWGTGYRLTDSGREFLERFK